MRLRAPGPDAGHPRRWIKGGIKNLFLILDNLRVHHAMQVSAWLAEHAAAIELFYLPSCSPELSPDVMAIADTGSRTHQAALCGLCRDTHMLS